MLQLNRLSFYWEYLPNSSAYVSVVLNNPKQVAFHVEAKKKIDSIWPKRTSWALHTVGITRKRPNGFRVHFRNTDKVN